MSDPPISTRVEKLVRVVEGRLVSDDPPLSPSAASSLVQRESVRSTPP